MKALLDAGNDKIVVRDADGNYRFSAEFANVADLDNELSALPVEFAKEAEAARDAL